MLLVFSLLGKLSPVLSLCTPFSADPQGQRVASPALSFRRLSASFSTMIGTI